MLLLLALAIALERGQARGIMRVANAVLQRDGLVDGLVEPLASLQSIDDHTARRRARCPNKSWRRLKPLHQGKASDGEKNNDKETDQKTSGSHGIDSDFEG